MTDLRQDIQLVTYHSRWVEWPLYKCIPKQVNQYNM